MRLAAGSCLAAVWLFTAAAVSADQGPYPATDAERRAAYDALQWHSDPDSYGLRASHAVIQLPAGRMLLLGPDAERFSWLASGTEYPGTEAVLIDEPGHAEVYYEWRNEGYIDDSDWADVDGDTLLRQYRDATKASSGQRVANGFAPMDVAGWLEPPHYDQVTRTVTYAVELMDKDGHWTNAIALRLGRAGYTEFTWVGSIDLFKSAGGRPALLDQALATHGFEEGYRYQDFKDGDKVAAYSVAGLVATALGVQPGTGTLAGTLAKIAIPALAVLAIIVVRFKELFGSFRRRS